MHSTWASAENHQSQAKVQSNRCHTSYTYREGRSGRRARCEDRHFAKGGTNVNSFGFFNQDGFEVVIWILVIIFLLSIFFDEGID